MWSRVGANGPPYAIVRIEGQAWVTKSSLDDAKTTPSVKPKSATTVVRAYQVLASILDVAVKDRNLQTNPVRGVELPRKSKNRMCSRAVSKFVIWLTLPNSLH